MTLSLAEGWMWGVWPAALLVSVAFDALFCGLETGIYILNKVRLDLHAEAGSRPAMLLQKMLRNPPNLLAVLLIGTNICRYAATFSVTAMFLLAGHEHKSEWLAIAVTAPLLFVISDSVPKGVFQRLGAAAVYRLCWLLRGADVLFKVTGVSPLVRFIAGALMLLTRTGRARGQTLGAPGLSAILAEGRASGLLTDFQSVMAGRVEHIGRVRLSDVMVPMSRVVAAPLDVTRGQLRQLMSEHNLSRMPLLAEGGRVAGVLDIFEVLIADDDTPPAEKKADPLVLPADMSVTDALYQMQREHTVLAVVESGGGHAGIVTVKDLVEEIVGELEGW
ncbi:MAG TPA: CNNM domain-containing protein [Phycisphaerae bacterium]|nr:CNNM domain-containing protein [Phycisphaerae bacterium]